MLGTQIMSTLRSAVVAATAAMGLGLAGGASAQQALDPAQIVGVWQGHEVAGGYSIGTEAIFFPNGTYRKTSVIGALMAYQSGNWAVAQNWLHLYPLDYGPRTYQGKAMHPPPSETWIVGYFDGTNLHATIGATSEISLQRAR